MTEPTRLPEFHLTRRTDLEVILVLYRKLTGREPTPEEIEAARADLENDTSPAEG
ncbi:MAG: hypothetical protein ACREKS_02440 [Candidatus Rokuibacteriota bacterium]